MKIAYAALAVLSVWTGQAAANDGDLARFSRVWELARKERPIRLATIGGSITGGAGASERTQCWPEVMVQAWRKKFPRSEITLVNAGIGATGSKIGACRLKDDVLVHRPDVVVVEFSVNDDASQDCAEAYEGLMRQLLSDPNGIAVIALGMMNKDGWSVQERHREVARHYGITFVSYRDAYFPSVRDGRLKWTEIAADSIHPNDRGHALAAGLLDDLLFADYDAYAAHPIPIRTAQAVKAPLYGSRFDYGRFVRMKDAEIVANEGFFPLKDAAWGMGLACTNANGRLLVRAKGRAVAILYRKGCAPYNWGKIAVSLDGGEPRVIDCFSDQWWWYTPDVFLCRDAPGEHLIEIRTLPEKNPKSRGYGCHLTGILVCEAEGLH